MSLFKKIFKLNPQTLGEGLKRVKNAFGVSSKDFANKSGERLYDTVSGDIVSINSAFRSLTIKKHLFIPKDASKKSILGLLNDYKGKLASITKYYNNQTYCTTVKLDRSIETERFSDKINQDLAENPLASKVFGAKTLEAPTKQTIKYHITKMPYYKAVSMGLKV